MALYLFIQIGAFLSRIIPRSWRYLIGTAVGDLVYWTWATKRKIARENMAAVLGLGVGDPIVKRLALKSMRNYLKYLVEFLELPVISTADDVVASIKFNGLHHFHDALARGRGVILASAHYGTIEIPGLRLKEMTDYHAVYDSFKPEYLDRLIQKKRLEKGIDLIPANHVRSMLRVLQAGGTLALLFDRPVELAKGVRVRFFGRETAVPAGPAVLAMKTGAALIPVYTWRRPDRTFETTVYPPVSWSPSGNREQDIQTITQKLIDTMQSEIRARPDQWYMFRRMWPAQDDAVSAPSTERAPDPSAR